MWAFVLGAFVRIPALRHLMRSVDADCRSTSLRRPRQSSAAANHRLHAFASRVVPFLCGRYELARSSSR